MHPYIWEIAWSLWHDPTENKTQSTGFVGKRSKFWPRNWFHTRKTNDGELVKFYRKLCNRPQAELLRNLR